MGFNSAFKGLRYTTEFCFATKQTVQRLNLYIPANKTLPQWPQDKRHLQDLNVNVRKIHRRLKKRTLECKLDSCGLEHDPGAASCENSRKCLSIVATINFSRGTDDDNDRHYQCQRKKRVSDTNLPVRTDIKITSRYVKAYWVRDGVGTRISWWIRVAIFTARPHYTRGKNLRYPLN